MKVVQTFAEARLALAGKRTALVPTLGALHSGHTSLVDVASREAEAVVMSVFVNPLQFDDKADLERYPRDIEGDTAIAAGAGVDVLFAPDIEEMYPNEPRARVIVTGVTEEMEGASRQGHFDGVATVVAKLFAGLTPDVAVFGRKDAQQLAVVHRIAADLSFPVRVVGAPTLRDADGVALSSRNVFLDDRDRARARALSAGLAAAADRFTSGEAAGSVLESIVRNELASVEIDPEYVVLADAAEARRIPTVDRPAFLAVAARVGSVRLIDNVFLWPDGSTDTGIRLDEERM